MGDSTPLTVTLSANTVCGITGYPSSIAVDQPFTVTLTLYDSTSFPYTPLPNKTLSLYRVNMSTGTKTKIGGYTTGSNGTVVATTAFPAPAIWHLRNEFAGDALYNSTWHETPDITAFGGPTQFANFTVSIISGLTIKFEGYLQNKADPTDSSVYNEPVDFQYYNDTTWVELVTVNTVDNLGYFSGTITLQSPGVWQFRVHYDGNASKGLQGCERNSQQIMTNGVVVPWIPIAIGIGVPSLLIALYYLTKKH